jgi:hypothetical protein
MVHKYNLSTREAEAEGLQVQDQPGQSKTKQIKQKP